MNLNRSASITVIIFSKDRALQLEAVIKSFLLHCLDADLISLAVIYTSSSKPFSSQYEKLKREYPDVNFILQGDFRRNIFDAVGIPTSIWNRIGLRRGKDADTANKFILFLVDDNIFIRDFYISSAADALQKETNTVGFALQLGMNINYCYPLDLPLKFPVSEAVSDEIIKYRWTHAGDGLDYPLEISSSLYRRREIASLFIDLKFSNPNTLESQMAARAEMYRTTHPYLLCYKQSVTFCNPLNKVQNIYDNRSGNSQNYSINALAQLFDEGYRIDVSVYQGFIPNACHQEVKLFLSRSS